MLRRWRQAALAACLLGLLSQTHAGPVIEVLPASSNLVVRIDLPGIRSSDLFRRGLAANKYQYEMIRSLFATVFGLDFEQIDRLWLISSAPEESLLLLEGEFAPETIRGKLEELPNLTTVPVDDVPHVSRFRGIQDGRSKLAAILGTDLLTVGDEIQVTRFLQAWRGAEAPLTASRPTLRDMAASQSHVTATLLDPKRWPEIDPGTAELITQNRVSATVGADIETVIELEAVDPQAARGLKHVLRGLTILAPKHPKVRGHGALVAAFASAVLERTGKSVSVWLTFPGDLIAEDLP